MSADTTQYLSTTEFANRYNAMMPIDKDHMPLEPSFVELLCEKGELEHSELPAGKGHKRYIYKIPEYELDRVAILINGDEFVKGKTEEAKPKLVSEKTLISTKDVAELLGCHTSHVNVLVREGKLVPARKSEIGKGVNGGRTPNMFEEDYILEYMEAHPTRKYTKKEKPVENKSESTNSKIKDLEITNAKLECEIMRLHHQIQDLVIENHGLKKKSEEASSSRGYSEGELFEAYRKGFKDGYEMGGKQ